jgi:conjugative transposon TraN protein
MKKILAIGVWLVIAQTFQSVTAQIADSSLTTLPSLDLEITTTKTTNIVFPYEVKSVDRGTRDVLVQVVKGATNIVQVKASRADFPVTNLSVITADGHLYSFLVKYASDPHSLNISVDAKVARSAENTGSLVKFVSDIPDAGKLNLDDSLVRIARQFLHISAGNERMVVSLRSIYYKDGLLWFLLSLHNNSLLTFFPSQFRFYIEDNHRMKRSAIQQKEELPVYSSVFCPDFGRSSTRYLFAFRPYTVPQNQRVVLQVRERFGGRILWLKIKHGVILKAKLWKP